MYAAVLFLVVILLLFLLAGAWLYFGGGTFTFAPRPQAVNPAIMPKAVNQCGVADRCLNDDPYLQRLLMIDTFNGSGGVKTTYDKILQNNEILATSLTPVVGANLARKLNELWDQKSSLTLDLYKSLHGAFSSREEKHRRQKNEEKDAAKEAIAEWGAKCLSLDRAAADILARSELQELGSSRLSAERLANLSSQYNEEIASQAKNLASGKFELSISHLDGARDVRRSLSRQIVSHMWSKLSQEGSRKEFPSFYV